VNDPLTEDERLAAYADGRLSERERAEMLTSLTADDDAYEVFAGLAAILLEAEAEDAVADAAADGVIALEEWARPQRDRPRHGEAGRGAPRRASIRKWMALAAVLAGVALVPGPALRGRMSPTGDPVRLAARLEQGSEGLPAGWNEPLPRSSTR
jgi:anti-sigma-K factor RskA